MLKRPLKIVSLDGGGLRGFSQLKILRSIMHRVKCDEYPNEPDKVVLPCEYFDLIGGSDTGGLIAIMFVKLRMSVEEVSEEFGAIMKDIYKKDLEPRERTARLKVYMKSLLIKRGFSPTLRLEAKKQEDCLCFVLARLSANSTDIVYLRTYRTRSDIPTGVTVVDAILATCASSEFLPVFAGLGYERLQYVGVGLGASNPIRQVIDERYSHFGRESSISLLLSIGSGHPGIISVIADAAYDFQYQLMLDREQQARDIRNQIPESDAYFRFSVEQGMQSNHTDAEGLSWILAQTSCYLAQQDTKCRIDQCIFRIRGEKESVGSKEIASRRHFDLSVAEPALKQSFGLDFDSLRRQDLTTERHKRPMQEESGERHEGQAAKKSGGDMLRQRTNPRPEQGRKKSWWTICLLSTAGILLF